MTHNGHIKDKMLKKNKLTRMSQLNKQNNIYFKNVRTLITNQYNYARLILFQLIQYKDNIQVFYEKYHKYINHINIIHPHLHYIYSNRLPLYLLKNKKNVHLDFQKLKMRLPSNTKIIAGKETYRKYMRVKAALTHIFEYQSVIQSHLLLIEECILNTIQSLNNFRKIYLFFINEIVINKNNFGVRISLTTVQKISHARDDAEVKKMLTF